MNMTENPLKPLDRFWKLLANDKKLIGNIYVYSIFNGLIALTLPLGIQAIVNLIQGARVSTSWVVLVMLVVFGVLVSGALRIFQLRITENIQRKLFTRAAMEFSFRISRIRLESLFGHYAPELMNRFFDINTVQKVLPKILIDFSSAVFLTIFSLILLSFYHPFFIAFGFFLLILIFIIIRYMAPQGLLTSLEESKYKYKVAHWLEELSRTFVSFKLAGNTMFPLEKTNDLLEYYLNARAKHFKILVRQYWLLVLFKVIITAGLLFIGGVLVFEQQMNIGQFIAAEIIIIIVLASVEKLILTLDSIYDILTSLEKIGYVTDMELEHEKGLELSPNKGIHIELRDISFSYPRAGKNTLNNVSTDFPPGSINIITGRNGSGKSTLLYVTAGLYELQSGTILYNEMPLRNFSFSSTRKVIGEYLLSDKLFEGTIKENITLGRRHLDIEDVVWAIEKAGLNEFVKNLRDGFESKILTEGVGLPDSVTHKLLIARCIVGNPKLLVFDNIFDLLDKKDAMEIIDFLCAPEHEWTIVAITDIRYFAQKADKIVVMEKGRLKKEGSFDDVKDDIELKSW